MLNYQRVVNVEARHPKTGLYEDDKSKSSHCLKLGLASKIQVESWGLYAKWICLKIVYPIVPNGFADHYPY